MTPFATVSSATGTFHSSAARDGGRADDEPAARQVGDIRLVRRFHEPPPGVAGFGALAPAVATFMPAAMWTAARIRWYVPQRQMLVIDSSMSASVGFGFLRSSAAAAMICPDWQ